MIPASLPDLDGFDPEALKALVIARHLESIEQHKSDTEQIEHLKLVIEKYRRMIFGTKSEKLTGELEQLEFRLEELETTQAAEEARQAASEATQPSSTQTVTKLVGVPRASPFRKIFRVKSSPIFPRITAAPTAAAHCGSSVKMSPNNWNVFRLPIR